MNLMPCPASVLCTREHHAPLAQVGTCVMPAAAVHPLTPYLPTLHPQLKALVDLHGEEGGLGGKLSPDEIKVITGGWVA